MHHAPDEWAGGSIVIQASDENAFTKPEVYMDRQNVYACKWRLQIRSPDFLVCSQSCPGTLPNWSHPQIKINTVWYTKSVQKSSKLAMKKFREYFILIYINEPLCLCADLLF